MKAQIRGTRHTYLERDVNTWSIVVQTVQNFFLLSYLIIIRKKFNIFIRYGRRTRLISHVSLILRVHTKCLIWNCSRFLCIKDFCHIISFIIVVHCTAVYFCLLRKKISKRVLSFII